MGIPIIVFLLLVRYSSARVYNIPEDWTAKINHSSIHFPATENGSYSLVSAFLVNGTSKQEFVLSDNGTFGLVFLRLGGTEHYYLSVVMGTTNSSMAAPVWTANRNQPAGENSVLKKTKGQLELLDLISNVSYWSPSKAHVASMSLEETGNFILFNEVGNMVWQSFDHPTNVLLPGQRLITGQSLVSNKNASTMAEGIFSATVLPSGVALFLNTPSAQQPYFMWSLTGSTIDTAQKVCSGYRTVVQYSRAGKVNMVFENTTFYVTPNSCGSPIDVALGSGDAMRYLQLEVDGNLISYKLNNEREWEQDFRLTQYLSYQGCSLPLACGSYGVCESGTQQKCMCLDQGASNLTSTSTTCQRPSWPSLANCSTKYHTGFVPFYGATYFTRSYTTPDKVLSSVEDCLDTCKLNCSCSAVFYERASRSCHFVQDVSGSLVFDSTQKYDAFLKFQDHSKLVEDEVRHSSFKKRLVTSLTVTASIVAITGSLLLLWALTKKQDKEIQSLLNTLQGPPRRFTYRSLVYATKGFSKHLGTGGFGSVFEGTLKDGKQVAVKKLHSSNHEQRQFVAEVASLGTVSHVNIVKLSGFCAELSHRLLVYEFMSNGSLDKWIFKNQEPPLEWSLRYSIALGTARGLAYLHEESREPIIHLDIKPQNILLDNNFVAKVADFGMAKLLISRETSQVVTGVRGTPGYLAPEWLLHSIATKKCDVYSYGMVLLELIGGRKNLDATKLDSELSWYFPAWAVNEVKQGNITTVVDPRIRDSIDTEQAMRMVKVALWCIQENSGDRPTVDAVVQMLEEEGKEISDPPLNFRFSVEAPGIVSIMASSESVAFGYSACEK